MPYYISDSAEGCSGWATVKDDGEVMGCHTGKQEAIDQALAIAQAEDSEYLGERAMVATDVFTTEQEAADRADEIGCEGTHSMDRDGNTVYMPCSTHAEYDSLTEAQYRAAPDALDVGDFVSWNTSGGRARGQIERIVRDNTINVPDSDFTIEGTEDDPAALIRIWREGEEGQEATDTLVGHRFSTLTKIADIRSYAVERRQVDLSPPAYMRAAARQGLRYHEEGLSGDGLRPQTVREARAMAEGNVSADKWVRTAAWISRHLDDLDSPAANPNNEDYPSAGVVAHLLWGSGPSKARARRALEYAERIVARLEEENRARMSVEVRDMAKVETRTQNTRFEVREAEDGSGMTFSGYAAVFNSRSEPLPFREKIAPGAFKRSLDARNDIKLLWNHDSGGVLGSTRAGTMRLEEDGYGLRVTADLPDTSTGRDAAYLLKRGDIDSMSFGFSVPSGGDDWSSDGQERTLNSVRLHEVSIVAFPAYVATAGSTMVRSVDAVARSLNVESKLMVTLKNLSLRRSAPKCWLLRRKSWNNC